MVKYIVEKSNIVLIVQILRHIHICECGLRVAHGGDCNSAMDDQILSSGPELYVNLILLYIYVNICSNLDEAKGGSPG